MLCRSKIDPSSVATAKKRLLQMHFESGVGHIGGNLSVLDAMLLVFNEFLNADDAFILSKGHSAGALYIALWSAGKLQDSDLTSFHKDNTLLPGHPPARSIADIAFATGSLGHGLSLAAGTALAFRLKQQNRQVFCITSDGEWQEGSTWEALIFACHQQLTSLTVLIDHNQLQGFGSTDEVASMAPLWDKLKGFNADVQVVDGHNLDDIRAALQVKQTKPRIIVLQTIKGHGVSFMENQMAWHYLPLTPALYQKAIQEIEEIEAP